MGNLFAVSWDVGKVSIHPVKMATMVRRWPSFLCWGMRIKSICQSLVKTLKTGEERRRDEGVILLAGILKEHLVS